MDTNEAYDRRREQVRKAQKTHRERKATYVKSLEIEVTELRKRNAALVAESKVCRDLIHQLQETLASKDLALPGNKTTKIVEKQPTGDAALCSMGHTSFPNQRLEVLYPERELTTQSEPPTALVNNSDAAVNFVLSLEQPCLYHHRIPSPELLMTGSIGGTGHSSMLSSIVMDRAPPFKFDPLDFGYPPDAEWYTPKVELEQLLRTSEKLGLDEEVTPIQIWNSIKQHPNSGCFTVTHLDFLRDRLHSLVKCYGFGAIVHRTEFEEVLKEMLKGVS